jgi:hypothetical protein
MASGSTVRHGRHSHRASEPEEKCMYTGMKAKSHTHIAISRLPLGVPCQNEIANYRTITKPPT